MKDNPTIIILAAGQGKRMNSSLPKPLHKVGGKPTLARVMEAARPISEDVVIVVGNGREAVMDVLGNDHRYAVQEEQRGTGHAVLSAKEAAGEVKAGDVVIVLPGDHPLMSTEAIRELLDTHRGRGAKITIVTHAVPDFEADRHISIRDNA